MNTCIEEIGFQEYLQTNKASEGVDKGVGASNIKNRVGREDTSDGVGPVFECHDGLILRFLYCIRKERQAMKLLRYIDSDVRRKEIACYM